MRGAGGLLTLTLAANDKAGIVRFSEALKHILMAVSWGGHESLIIPKCAGIADGDFDKNNPEHRMVRLYVGLEDPDYLLEDIYQAFDKM
ncbi:MAG: PLP-dependent transferase [Chitinophagaceae bacterium]|nr:PLP-dependent transferase [Chitinophagaceae bacterium]